HTYFVDPEAGAELSRLMHQDRLMTQALEGPLPERQDMEKMEMLLDVACGPGGWVLEVARQYRHLQVVDTGGRPRAPSARATGHIQEHLHLLHVLAFGQR